MRIGVFGGEFDPPHLGHLAVVRAARDQLALDRLLVIPTGRPPHRDASPTPGEDRLRMAQLAFAGEPGVEVSRIELDREGPSYTVDTLRALAPLGELVLIVGADQCDLRSWREPDEILRLASLAVAPRGGHVRVPGCERGRACHGPRRPVVDDRPRTPGRGRGGGRGGPRRAGADQGARALRQTPVLGCFGGYLELIT